LNYYIESAPCHTKIGLQAFGTNVDESEENSCNHYVDQQMIAVVVTPQGEAGASVTQSSKQVPFTSDTEYYTEVHLLCFLRKLYSS
jgi:hypothetical protein